MEAHKTVLIGGAAGGPTDTPQTMKQLLGVPGLQYVILDFMSEAILAQQAAANVPGSRVGFATEFFDEHIVPNLRSIHERGVRVISNAGAMNPRGLAAAIEEAAAAEGLTLKVAAIEGDNVLEAVPGLHDESITEMFTGEPLPAAFLSATAYLGAFPIAAALAAGADMVVTGRVADSAMALGPLIHEFGWGPEDADLLASGTAAGHLIECAAQVTGGTFTDWQDVPGWDDIGYPIAEFSEDGTFVITKPAGTGGLVSVGTTSEQLLYEVSDPRAYIVPDVVCDFTHVQLQQTGPDRVQVTGVRGRPATTSYKVCGTYYDGWRTTALAPIIGIDAPAKADRRAEALFTRWRRILAEQGLAPERLAYHEVIGTEASYGWRGHRPSTREVLSKLVVEHEDRLAAEQFFREERASQMNLSVGTASGIGFSIGAPKVQQVSRLFSFLCPKDRLKIRMVLDGHEQEVPIYAGTSRVIEEPSPEVFDPMVLPDHGRTVRLIDIAWARSGDKGDKFNVAVIARDKDFVPYIRAALTEAAVGSWFLDRFSDLRERSVERFEVPGINAFNFVVNGALMLGAASSSPLLDRSAKGMAQQLLEHPIVIPATMPLPRA